MDNATRFRLHFGPYVTPRFRYGRVVFDEVRGLVEIVGLTDGRIPWPVGKRGRRKVMVVYDGLARAVKRESAIAVCHWWGLTGQTITRWRQHLGVGPTTEGTRRLKREHFGEPWALRARAKAHAVPWTRARRKKLGRAKRGKPHPPRVRTALRRANLGRRQSKATRRKRSETFKRLGIRPPKAGRPWKVWENALLTRLSAAEVARRTGRTLLAAYSQRARLGLRDGRRERWKRRISIWHGGA